MGTSAGHKTMVFGGEDLIFGEVLLTSRANDCLADNTDTDKDVNAEAYCSPNSS